MRYSEQHPNPWFAPRSILSTCFGQEMMMLTEQVNIITNICNDDITNVDHVHVVLSHQNISITQHNMSLRQKSNRVLTFYFKRMCVNLDCAWHKKLYEYEEKTCVATGNDLLISWRKQILQLATWDQTRHKLRLMRHLIGQSLHLIQDFYSNTDWTEMRGEEDDFFRNLGNGGLPRTRGLYVYQVAYL